MPVDELVEALLLAREWFMEDVCKVVIGTIARREMDIVTKAALGVTHRVREWAFPSLATIANRGRSFLTVEEGHILGMETVLALVSARDCYHSNFGSKDHSDFIKKRSLVHTWDSA